MISTSRSGQQRIVTTRKPRVLFVDDEPKILHSMRWLFKKDYDLTFASSGQEAIELLGHRSFEVIVSDQKMPGITGVEVLQEAQRRSPGSMRILLTGYADLKSIIGSINEGEVFRFITKPWSNDELKAVVKLAAQTAMRISTRSPDASRAVAAPRRGGVLLIDRDPEIRSAFGKILEGKYLLHYADDLDQALDLLDREKIQVVVSETHIGQTDITSVIKLLKRHHPNIISIVLTEHRDAEAIIDLINEGQIFRFLRKPVKFGQCRLSIQSAMVRYVQLMAHPELCARYRTEEIDEERLLTQARRRGMGDTQAGVLRQALRRLTRLFSGGMTTARM